MNHLGTHGAAGAIPTQDLYRFYGANGDLLYVGISRNALARMVQHKATQPWWPEVANMTVEHHEASRAAMLAMERRTILVERPRYNVHHGTARRRSPTDSGPEPLSASATPSEIWPFKFFLERALGTDSLFGDVAEELLSDPGFLELIDPKRRPFSDGYAIRYALEQADLHWVDVVKTLELWRDESRRWAPTVPCRECDGDSAYPYNVESYQRKFKWWVFHCPYGHVWTRRVRRISDTAWMCEEAR